MNRKILFLDLDGTLLKDNKKISSKNIKSIRKILDEGHYIAIATGRAIQSGIDIVKKLGLTLPGSYLIAYNGAIVYDCSAGRILVEKTIPIEYVEYLFTEAQRYGLYVQTYAKGNVLTQDDSPELEYYTRTTGMHYKLADNVFHVLENEPNKVLIASLKKKDLLERFQKEHMEWEENKCNSFFSCDEYLEYCPANTDKGTGVRYLMELLNISAENSVAVGDERNDIPMLQAAYIGIAMKNGKNDVKMAASYITENDNNQDAISEIIEKFIL